MNTVFNLGHQFDLHFAWAPSTGMVRATYRAEIERYEPKGDRVQCKLIELLEASGVQAESELSPAAGNVRTFSKCELSCRAKREISITVSAQHTSRQRFLTAARFEMTK